MGDNGRHTRLRLRFPKRLISHNRFLSSRHRSRKNILFIIVFVLVSTAVVMLRVFVAVVLPFLIMALNYLVVLPERGLIFLLLRMVEG